ncbi:MAG: hypothetical protein WC806_04095, partial [Candidatus Gracilibacteria bacterium]
MFLKLKKVIGEGLSNKEAMRRLLKKMTDGEIVGTKSADKREQAGDKNEKAMMVKNIKLQEQAKKQELFPGESRAGSEASEATITKLFEVNKSNQISDILPQATDNAKRKPAYFCQKDNLIKKIYSDIHKKIINQPSIKITRYIPVSIKRQVLASTRERCAHPNCPNPAQIFHHQDRFSQTKSHD